MSGGRRSGLGRASIAMFAATVALNLAMVVYHRVMSSRLGDAYAQLAALTGVVNVLNVLAMGALATLAKLFAHDTVRQGDAAAAARLKGVARRALVWAAGSAVVLLALTPASTAYLRLPQARLFAMTALLFAGYIAMVVSRAVLQGRRAYGSLAASYVAEGAGRLGFAWGLVAAGWGVMGALWGAAAAQVSVVLACLPGYPRHDGRTRAEAPPPGLWAESASDTLVMILFSLLCFLDIFVVKHHWDEARVAQYARAALIGKSFLYLVSALTMVLLPEVAAARAKGGDPRPLLWRFLGWAALLELGGLAVVGLQTPLAIRVLCGANPEFQQLVPLVRGFSLAVIPLALFQLVMTYHVALGTRSLPWIMAVGTGAYALALEASIGREASVVAALGCSAAGLLAAGAAAALRRPAHLGASA